MALPVSVSTLTLAGTYVDLFGNPVRGSITLKPQVMFKEKTANVIAVANAIVLTLDANGHFSQILPCTDVAAETPNGFTYTVTENFNGGRSFAIALLSVFANTTVDLSTLVPSVALSASASYVTTAQYLALSNRYSTAEGIRVIVVTAPTHASNAQAYSDATLLDANNITASNAQILMLMGM